MISDSGLLFLATL